MTEATVIKETGAKTGKKSKWAMVGKILMYGWPLILIAALGLTVLISTWLGS